MTYQRHCSHRQRLGEVVQRGAGVVDREVALALGHRPGVAALRAADQRQQRVGVLAEVGAQLLDVPGPGIELGVDAGGAHEEVVGAPQVLGQAGAAGRDEPLEGLEVGRASPPG